MMNEVSRTEQFQELTPVICDKCGSAIPLADMELTNCIYCAAPVAIPAHYRRGQDARRRLSEIRRHASEFLSRLGSHPRKWEIWVSMLPSWAFFMILIFLTFSGFTGSIISLELGVSRIIGTNISDYLPEIVVWPLYIGIFFLFLGLAMAGFFLIRRRVFVTRRLMTVLAAGEPVKPGGPATCRKCGAPFQVGNNEVVAACDYCGTENFLQVPPEWLSATRKLSSSSGRNVFWAEREFEREMTSSHTSMMNQIKIFGVFMVLLTGGFLSGDSSKMKVWRDDVKKAVRPVYGFSRDVAVPEIGKPFKIHGIFRKYRNEREFRYQIALKKGETLAVSVLEEGPVRVLFKGRYSSKIFSAGVDKPVEFTAEPGGWFYVSMITHNDKPLPLIQIDLK